MASVEELFVILRAESAPFVSGLRTAAAEGETFAARMGGTQAMVQKLANGIGLIGIGVAAVSVKMAADFEQQVKRLQTSAGESESNLKMVGDGILKIARDTGTATEQLTNGAYRIESAGIHGADALKVLKAAAEGAKAEGADLDTVSNALTSTLKAFKAPVSEASDYMSKYVAIVSNGKVSMQELASAMPNVEAVASAAHVSFAQLGGAMATMTTHGESAQQAAQWLSFAIRNLEAPNMVAVKAMEQLGLSSTDIAQKLGERGLTGTIRLISETILSKMGPSGLVMLDTFKKSSSAADDAKRMLESMPPAVKKLSEAYLSGSVTFGDWRTQMKALPTEQANLANQFKSVADKVNGFSDVIKAGGPAATTYVDQLKKIMGGANGMQAALQLGGQYMGDFEKNVAAVSAATADADGHVHGFAESQETLNAKLAQVKAAVSTLAIELGTKLIPPIKDLLDFFLEHHTAAKILAGVIGGLLVGGIISLGVTIMVAMGPIGWITAAIVALTVVIIEVAQHWDQIWGWIKGVAKAVGRAVADAWNWVADKTSEIWNKIAKWVKDRWNDIAGFFSSAWHKVTDPILKAWDMVKRGTEAVWNGISGFFKKWWPLLLVIFLPPIALIIGIWNHFHEEIELAARTVWNGILAFFRTVWNTIKQVASVVWDAIKSAIVDPIVSVWHKLEEIGSAIKDVLSGVWNSIAGTVSHWWGEIRDRIIAPLMEAWQKIITIGSYIGSAIWGALIAAWNAVKDVGSWFKSIGEAIVHGIINGVSGAASGLYDKLKGLANGALSAAKSALGIGSPSKVFAAEVGQWIPEGVAAGVGAKTPAAVRAVEDMSKSLARPAALAFRAPGSALAANRSTAAAAGGSTTNITVHVAGSVLSEKRLYDVVQKVTLQHGKRNPTTGLQLTGR